MTPRSFQVDLDAMFGALADDWPRLGGKTIFMTGGTGFIGRWMLEALADADRRLGLEVKVTILTRNPAAFAAAAPHIAGYSAFDFVTGDVLSLGPDGNTYDYVIHAATDASADLNENDPRRMFDTIVTGTRLALDFADTLSPGDRAAVADAHGLGHLHDVGPGARPRPGGLRSRRRSTTTGRGSS